MDTGDLTFLNICELTDLLRLRQVSPVEVVTAHLDRISAVDSTLRCFITVTPDAALAQARQAELEIMRGDHRGPLHGVPVAYKDIFMTDGVRTTAHSRLLEHFVPDRDAVVVLKLKRSGAISLGKANTHEFAAGGMDIYGLARNPWDLSRVAGASSSGSACAVAAGLVPCSIGSDTGGSVRIPAAFCGVVGLRPTYGRVSRRGMLPLSWSMDQAGPLTRTVRDAAILLEAIAGRDGEDPTTSCASAFAYVAENGADLKGVRIGVPNAEFLGELDPVVAESYQASQEVFEALGATLCPVCLPMTSLAAAAGWVITYVEAFSAHAALLSRRARCYGQIARMRIRTGASFTGEEYVRALRVRALVLNELAAVFKHVDVLLTPTTAYPAYPQRDLHLRLQDVSRFTRPFSLAGLPAVSVPAGLTEDNLPLAIQVAAPPWREVKCLHVAEAFERVTGRRSPLSVFDVPSTEQLASSATTAPAQAADPAHHRRHHQPAYSASGSGSVADDRAEEEAVAALVESVRTKLSSSVLLEAVSVTEVPQHQPLWDGLPSAEGTTIPIISKECI